MWQSRRLRWIPNWGSCWRIICNLLSKVISTLGGPKLFFICLFDIVFFFVSNRGIHHNFLLIDTYNKRWQRPSIVIRYSLRLFVLSFIQAFNCQATKCKQISSRSSSNNHKSLQPFSRYWSWNMQHATWKHDRDCRLPQVPQVDIHVHPKWARIQIAALTCPLSLACFFFSSLFFCWLWLPSRFIHSIQLNKFPIVSIGSIGETTFLFCPKNWQKKQAREREKLQRIVEKVNNKVLRQTCNGLGSVPFTFGSF